MNQEQTTDTIFVEGDKDIEQDVVELANRARDAIEEFVQDQPHVALGIAAATGFVLGGGLTPRRLLRIGFAAGGPTLTKQITSQLLRIASESMDQQQQRGDHDRAGESSGRSGKARKGGRKEKESKENA